ncbi:MAG: hypothetical protein J0H43_16250, partial [Actinobacteria bacterium]|nr:hypothetical protein [Actinomycetota bacterium]
MEQDGPGRRQAAVELVLEHARHNPAEGLPYDLPGVRAEFGSRRELLLELERLWAEALLLRVERLPPAVRRRATQPGGVAAAARRASASASAR